MKDFQNLDLPVLIDLLSEYTLKYSKILADGGDEYEYYHCRRLIQRLQSEIAHRKNPGDNKTVANTNITFRRD
jgi:hypothetical protein